VEYCLVDLWLFSGTRTSFGRKLAGSQKIGMAGSSSDTSMTLLTEYYDALETDPSSVHIHELLVELWQELGNLGMDARLFGCI
jgi:hypothetical protein